MTNPQQYLLTTTSSPAGNGFHVIPTYTVGTGTISSDANDGRYITGVGTLFTDEVKILEWLGSATNNEASQVNAIVSDTTLVLQTAFVTPLAAAALLVIPKTGMKRVTLFPRTGATGTINGAAFTAAHTYEFVNDPPSPALQPIQVNVTAGVVEVTITY